MKVCIFFILAILIALIDSSPLPQAPPAPAPAAGGEKKIAVVGPGPGPWSVGSQQVCTWWSTGFTSDDPVTITTHADGSTTPIFSADSTLNKGSVPIPITDAYKAGTNYVTEVALKSDPGTKGTGPTFTVTGGGGGGGGGPAGPAGGPPPGGPSPAAAGGPGGPPPAGGGPPAGPPPAGAPSPPKA
uniref:Uncharacterized protein n=1 Tax=Anthurium amnicola TaxID=1678845 RepID=A0A1D1ZLP0_9ARAE